MQKLMHFTLVTTFIKYISNDIHTIFSGLPTEDKENCGLAINKRILFSYLATI